VFLYSLKVCQGSYDDTLIKAWEAWDEKNHSENDHPKEFPEKQVAQFSL
jgi:serine/threonine-protein kinase haspin